MKTSILYHDDADGFGAAFAAWLKLGFNETDYLAVNYGYPVPDLPPDAEVFILDFHYPPEVLRAMKKSVQHITVIDHHSSTVAALKGFAEPGITVILNQEHSGAVLAWHHFHPNEALPKLLEYIEDRDLWRWKLPLSREVSYGLQVQPCDFSAWNALIALPQALTLLANDGQAIQAFVRQQVERNTRQVRWLRINTKYRLIDFLYEPQDAQNSPPGCYYCPAVNASSFASEVAERLLQLYPFYPFVCCYQDLGFSASEPRISKRKWELRARPGFQAATKIAVPMGGGGHEQACGFNTDM